MTTSLRTRPRQPEVMRSRFSAVPLTCALALGLPAAFRPALARAQDAHESKDDANTQYRRAFAELAKRNWLEARRQFLPLWLKAHTWDVAAGLGQAEFFLENYAAGATYTAFALANVPPKEKTKTVERLRAALDEMKAAVGTVHVAVNRDGAEISADHALLGISPLTREVYLNPGPRLLEARLANGASGQQTLTVTAGESYRAFLIVEGSPSAPAPVGLPSASHSDGGTPGASAKHADRASPNWTPMLVTGGLAVVAAAIGTGFAIDAGSAKSDGEKALGLAEAEFGSNPCTPSKGGASALCQSVNELEDRRKISHGLATGSFITGGVFAVAAVGSYFLWARPNQARLDAWLGTEGGGLRLNGSF